MTTSIEAVYEGGVLRLKEPLSLPEGTAVRVAVSALPNGNGSAAPGDVVSQANDTPRKTPAEIMAEIAAVSVDYGEEETSSINHDEVLYGWKKETQP